MKTSNFLLLITLIFSTLFCPSCELPKSGIWIKNADEIVAVQLISYENPDCNWIRNKNKVLPSLFYSKMHVIEDLPSGEIESFIEEVPYIEYWIDVNYDSPQSYCLKVVYANCDFLIACFQNGFFAKWRKLFCVDRK